MFDAIKRMFGLGGSDSGTAMISCDEVRARLFEYLDSELDSVSEEEVKRHLDACPECYPRVVFEQRFLESLRGAGGGASTGPELKSRILEALNAEGMGPA